MKGHKLSLQIYSGLKREEGELFKEVLMEEKIPIPNFSIQYCPTTDILINVDGKRLSIIEIDDDNDPGRSIVKYWQLLHYYKDSEFRNYSLVFIEVFRRGSTIGDGYKVLAEFIGERFKEYYSKFFKFFLLDAFNRDVSDIVADIIKKLK